MEPDPRTDPVKLYLADIGRVPLLTKDDEVALAISMRDGEAASHHLEVVRADEAVMRQPGVFGARFAVGYRRQLGRELGKRIDEGDAAHGRMIQANLRLVVSIAKRYQGFGLPLLDVVQEGNMGLMRAVDRFDHTKGFKFSTYATWWIRQSINRGIADGGSSVRIPPHTMELAIAAGKAEEAFIQEFERMPTLLELEESMGVSAYKIAAALQARAPSASLDDPLRDEGATYADLLSGDEAGPDEEGIRASVKGQIAKALANLDDAEREIMRRRLLTNEPDSYEAIAQDLGMHRATVSRMEKRALGKLSGDPDIQRLQDDE